MKVKRYFASNMRSALEMIRQDQGPDVLILSNRKVDGGVELITADELTEQEAARFTAPAARRRPELAATAATGAAAPAPNDSAGGVAPTTATTTAAAPTPGPATAAAAPFLPPHLESAEYLWTDAGTVAQMREELRNLKGLLESQLCGLAWSDFGNRHPLRARLLRVLTQVGLCPGLARALVAEVPDDMDYRAGWHRALALLVTRLRGLDDPILRSAGRVALLGPTGVGKSTVVSKLAARHALKAGADKVTIVSMDDRRLGAHQQLKAFGRLLGTAVHVARDCGELALLLEDFAPGSLVLIDTPGAAPDDSRYQDLARSLVALDAGISLYNVMSATTDYLTATKQLQATAGLDVTGCILTKLDEAATLGPTLSAIIECGPPLAYTCAGQCVPDDLDPVDARALVERTIALAKATPAPRDQTVFERAFSA
jgi:flagellar biosynthesis protein FlhF